MPLLPLLAAMLLPACEPNFDNGGKRDDTADPDADADTDADTDTDSDADADSDTDADTDADSDADADTDSDTDADTDTDVDYCALDNDGDGFTSDDCYPWDEDRFPGQNEGCNGRDDDCDGDIDEDDVCTWALTGEPDRSWFLDTGTAEPPPPPDTGASPPDTGGPPPPPDTGGPTPDTGGPTPDTGVPVDTGDTGTTVDTGGDPGDDIDDDRDGYTENDGDCNDDPRAGGRRIFPGAVEVCTDGLDNDCDGLEDYDDGDDCTEPGVGYAYWVGDAYVCDPETFGGGHFGLEMLNEDGNSTCVVMGDWYDDGGRTPRSACPGCDWMFSLSLRDSVAAGPYCDDYGFTDGMFDGYFQYVWAFAETYYSYENVLFIYYGGSWYPIWETDGDATHFTLSASSGSYYYYYP